MKEPKLFTKDFISITVIHFFAFMHHLMLMVIISQFAMYKFGSSPAEAGLVAGMFIFGTLIARLLSGRLVVFIGQKKILYTGLILGLVTTGLYFEANSVILLLLIRFLHGVSLGLASTSAGTIAAKIIPKKRTGEGMGYFSLSITGATAIGPFLGMFISQHGSYSMIFTACAIMAAINMVIVLFLSAKDVKLTEKQFKEMKGFKLNNYFESKVFPISIVLMVIYFCYSSVLSFCSVYAKEINLVEAASFFFIVFAAVTFFSRPFVGRLFDSKGENLIMYSSILIFMIGMSVFSQAHNGIILLLAGVLFGLGFGALQSSGPAIAVKLTEQHRMGLATSTYWSFVDIGLSIGPLVFGLIIPYTGYRGMYICAAIVLTGCMFLYYLLHGKKVVLKS